MRVLIIGGTRFIGPHVVRQLSALEHEVALFNRGQTEADLPDGVKHILGDRQHLADFSGAFKRFSPQVVLDMIPLGEQDAQLVMRTFKGIAQRVIAISSQDVYRAYGKLIGIESGPTEPIPLTEDAPLRQKRFPYRGQSRRKPDDPRRWLDDYDKILVERVVMGDPGLPGTVLRLPMVYGPGDPQHRLFPYLKRMDDHRPAILLEESMAHWRWTKGYVENVATAVTLAITDERAAGRIYNVGERDTLSEADWVKAIGTAAGWHGKVMAVPEDRLPDHLRSDGNVEQHLVADTTRIRRELGYKEPVHRGEALQQSVAWARAHAPQSVDPKMFDYAAEDAILRSGN
jgi:nucleoside-diphosphate-sugar epimerase